MRECCGHFSLVRAFYACETQIALVKGSMNRDKSAKFVELANKRVNRAIKDLSLIANLANRQNYEYSDEQAKKIVKSLQHGVDGVKQSFLSNDPSSQSAFKL